LYVSKKLEMINRIKQRIESSIKVKEQLLQNETLLIEIEKTVEICVNALKADKKLLFAGNGGSAADAQHLAAEFSGRFYKDRTPLYAEALHVNSSYLTAVANDYSYDEVYSRMIIAKGRPGDVFIGISTSGNSKNIIKAIEAARKQQMHIIGMTGENGGIMKSVCDILLNMPSNDTPRIQEAHILVGHIICEFVEEQLF
jgi:D-sedoheptulose 7-phosphate isomerase